MPPQSPPVCRICLSVDVNMYKIAETPLQRVFEKLTSYSLVTSDRPVLACYMCCARLHTSRKLMLTAARADLAFTTILDKSAKVTKKAVCSLDRQALGLCPSLVFSRPECVEFQPANSVPFPLTSEPLSNLTQDTKVNAVTPEDLAEDEESVDELEDGEEFNELLEEPKILEESNHEKERSELKVELEVDDAKVELEVDDAKDIEFVQLVDSPEADNSEWEADDNIPLRDSVAVDHHAQRETETEENERQENEELEPEIHSSLKEHPDTDRFISASSSDEYQPSDDSDDYISDCSGNHTEGDATRPLEDNKLQESEGNNLIEDVMPLILEAQQTKNNMVKRGRNKNYCFYCETKVLNFARHIVRHHYDEVDVQKILSLSKRSQERRNLLANLIKKGNYISNMIRFERPMRLTKGLNQSDYLPCSTCLGFYSRKQLWKHKKKCCPEKSSKNVQAEAQNFMCLHSSHTLSKPLENVFCRMRADHISYVAKRDPMICEFGESLLKKLRQEDFIIHYTSRKMRELSKLFIQVRKKKPEIETLFDALKPQNYDALVAATKIVAKHDENSDRLNSPSYAMNISTSIKQCCNIAIKAILKTDATKKAADIQADLRALIQLIESRWKFDVSSKAAEDLYLRKINNVTIIPLAKDLKLLKDHLCSAAKNASARLLQDENCENTAAYNDLVETVFCRVLLLNQRRPLELQRLLISTYTENKKQDIHCEKFHRILSPSEKNLVQHFKRIVIRGKLSRGVYFSKDVQQDLDLLFSLRSKYIDADNKFLFARPSVLTTLHGYKVLQKHVKWSGAKHPEAICSTKLRRHLATLTQLFNMSEVDIKQLLNVMGHTTVHGKNYRLPDDISLTAKIAKLLILMEDGKADAYKGKTLDEINFNMEEHLEGEGLDTNDIIAQTEILHDSQSVTVPDTNEPESVTVPDTNAQESVTKPDTNDTSQELSVDVPNVARSGKRRVLVPWTTKQKNVVINHFKRHITAKKAPKRLECDALKALHPQLLHNKDWLKIKVFIQNAYNKK